MTAPRTWTLRLVYDRLPLSLNDRKHYMVRWAATKLLRDRVRLLTRHLEIPRLEALHVDMEWTPRTRRPRDADNAVATLKPAIDGLRDYAARYKTIHGRRVLIEPAWTGVIADDDDAHVSKSMPKILPVNPDPFLTERLVLILTERSL